MLTISYDCFDVLTVEQAMDVLWRYRDLNHHVYFDGDNRMVVIQ